MMQPEQKYRIVFWLFMCNDRVVETGLTFEEANKRVHELNDLNGDRVYSGYWLEPELHSTLEMKIHPPKFPIIVNDVA